MAWRLGRSYPLALVDRRQHLRIPVRLFLSFSGGRIKGEGTVLDISMGGCMIQSDAPVHVDDIFYLQISLGEHEPPLEVAAMVRSVVFTWKEGVATAHLATANATIRVVFEKEGDKGVVEEIEAKDVPAREGFPELKITKGAGPKFIGTGKPG